MPRYVSKDVIDMRVVENWDRLVRETASDRGHDLRMVQPFPPFEQMYPDVMIEIRANSHEGIELYRRMVRALPWYDFE